MSRPIDKGKITTERALGRDAEAEAHAVRIVDSISGDLANDSDVIRCRDVIAHPKSWPSTRERMQEWVDWLVAVPRRTLTADRRDLLVRIERMLRMIDAGKLAAEPEPPEHRERYLRHAAAEADYRARKATATPAWMRQPDEPPPRPPARKKPVDEDD